jgi:hypothetical protein
VVATVVVVVHVLDGHELLHEPPAPHDCELQPFEEQGVLQASDPHTQPPQFVGRPDTRDKLLIVGTVAESVLVYPLDVPDEGHDVIED